MATVVVLSIVLIIFLLTVCKLRRHSSQDIALQDNVVYMELKKKGSEENAYANVSSPHYEVIAERKHC